jgi:hypothetical protein
VQPSNTENGYNQLPDEKTRGYWLLDEKLQENIVNTIQTVPRS